MQVVQSEVEQRKPALGYAVDVVLAYVINNHVQPAEIPGLIQVVHTAFHQLTNPPAGSAEPELEKPNPSAIRRSITPDWLISFIDGKPYKTLRRHLTKNGLDHESYKARYGLPSNYPATSANYSATRAELARTMGLGSMRKDVTQADPVESDDAQPREAAPKRRGRPPKTA